MLYLEDYLEMIEHVPQEFRDRFTEMREMDLSIQNNMDTLEKRVRTLFAGCRRGEINNDQANTEFADIKKGYNKTLEEADEKLALANQTYELVDRYLKRLDTELHNFKCELEADNKGITELLEKRSLELDAPAHSPPNNNHYKETSRYRMRAEKRRSSWARDHKHHMSRTDSAVQAALSRESYSLAQAGSAIAAAATQAIAATQQMSGGRRTASLKASYEAVTDLHHHEHGGVVGVPSAAIHVTAAPAANKRTKHNKKSTSYSGASSAAVLPPPAASRPQSPALVVSGGGGAGAGAGGGGAGAGAGGAEAVEEEWSYDPDEPRYCVCNQVSYGDMVACDNHHCPYEWFHYPCVGITAPPRGKWYCPQCTATMRRHKHHRKN